jgi:hypothetical protein
MVERFAQVDDQLYAVLSNGELITTPLSKISWKSILPGATAVHAMTYLVSGG